VAVAAASSVVALQLQGQRIHMAAAAVSTVPVVPESRDHHIP